MFILNPNSLTTPQNNYHPYIQPLNNYNFDVFKVLKKYNIKIDWKNVSFSSLDGVKKKCLPNFTKTYQQKQHKTLRDRFKNYSKLKEQGRKDFAKKYQFKNKKLDKKIDMESMKLINILKNDAKKTQFQIQQIQELHQTHEHIFLTMTLPPKFHSSYFCDVNNKKVNNVDFDTKLIREGYENLNNTFRQMYKNLQKIDPTMKYIKMVEPHKDLTPHIHIQFWIDKQHINRVKTSISETITNKVEQGKLGEQWELIKLQKQEGKNISNYITKYIVKLLDDIENNEDKIYLLDGWKRKNKFRLFGGSNPKINKSLYNTIISIAPNDLDKEEYPNMGIWALKNVRLIRTIDNETKIKNIPKNDNYIIHINKIRMYKIIDSVNDDIEMSYKRIFIKVFDVNENFKCVKDSRDWEMIDKIPTPAVIGHYLHKIKTYKDLNIINNLEYENDLIQYEIFKHNYSIY